MQFKKIIPKIFLSVFSLFFLFNFIYIVNAQPNDSGWGSYNFNVDGQAPTYQDGQSVSQGTGSQVGTFQELVSVLIVRGANLTIRLLVALSLFMFLFGLMKYMFKGQGSDTARTEGRKLMLWGIIGLFVISSVWGLVAILASLVGHSGVGLPQFR